MFKVIWDQEKHKQLSKSILLKGSYKIIDEKDGLEPGQMGIICDEEDIDKIKPILKEIEFEKAQMIFPTSEGFLQVYVHKISYIESFGEDIVMHMMNKDTEMIKKPLYQIETLLKPFQFSRIGKSFIVNLRNIRYIRVTYYAKLELELLNKDIVYVSRSYVSKFKDALGIK